MRTFEILHYGINDQGDVSKFSYFLNARNWEHAETLIPPTHWVHGLVMAVQDEETGITIDLDNLN